jgi:hypothetical protein
MSRQQVGATKVFLGREVSLRLREVVPAPPSRSAGNVSYRSWSV